MVEIARRTGAQALAHGCTGKGNDQLRFELSFAALAPDLRVIAPWREWDISSREDAFAYADARGISLEGIDEEKLYSRDENLWHISHEGGPLEDPANAPGDDVFLWTCDPAAAPDRALNVEVGFEKGIPVTVDGEALSPLALLETLNALGSEHGVGRADVIEDRVVGIKSRGVYETPGGTILLTAIQELEQLVLSRRCLALKDDLAPRYADLVYEGESVNAIRSMDDSDRVIHMGSFSKNLAPGMRLGYVVASWQILGQLLPLKGDIGTSNFGQMVTAEFFNNHYEEHVETLRTALRRKRDTMTAAISEHFGPMVKPNHPRGGIYLWVTFPEDVDTRKALATAQKMGIGYNPGSDWAVYPGDDERNGNNCIRFCYALPTEDEIWEGIELLAQVFQRELGFPKEG
jgi:hypothetical protein